MLRQRFVNNVPSLHHEHASYMWWVLANVMLGTFMSVLNNSIVNTALPKIMASSGITLDVAQWIITAYMIAFGVMLPTSGWIADHWGYKRTYAAGLAIFTLFSFLCGLSWDEKSLIVFRILQGLGGGIIMPVGMAIIMREFPYEKRGMAIGFWSISSAASISFGPMLGGYLVDNFDWHLIFFISVPVGLLSIFTTAVVQREYRTAHTRLFDLAGFVSMSVFLSFLLIALSSGNAQWNTGGWTSDFLLLCYFLSAIGFVVFLITELNVKHPLVDLRLLANFNFGLTNIVLFMFGLGMFGSIFLLPLYFQNSLGYTAMQSGMFLIPIGIIQGIFSPIAGVFSDKVNPKIPAVAGVVLLALGLYINSIFSLYTEQPMILASLIIRGVAFGILFTPLSTLALAQISKKDMAQASGLTNVIRQVGGSFGVAIFQTLLSQRVSFHTAMFGGAIDASSPAFVQVSHGLAVRAMHDAGQTVQNAAIQSKLLVLLDVSKQAFVQGINDDFLVAALFTLFCVIPIVLLKFNKFKKAGIA